MAPMSFPSLPEIAQQLCTALGSFPSFGGGDGVAGRGGEVASQATTPPLRGTPPGEGNEA